MSWLNDLYVAYDNRHEIDGMLPVSFAEVKAGIDITIDADGNFVTASNSTAEKIRIPVTEESAGRTSAPMPHPIFDNLGYVCKGFGDHKDGKDEKCNKKFALYLEFLKKWVQSEYATPEVKSVYAYVSQGTMFDDLVHEGIIEIDENGAMKDESVESKIVAFMLGQNGRIDVFREKAGFVKVFQDYYRAIKNKHEAVSYLSGEKVDITENHPRAILPIQSGAKVISSNDGSGFTYRGRFIKPEEAFSIGYEEDQKVHNALKWLVEKRGTPLADGRYLVCFCPTIDVDSGMNDLLFNGYVKQDDNDESSYEKFRQLLKGKREKFTADENVVVMALKAPTKGCVSITYYQSLMASDFWNRVEYWFDSIEIDGNDAKKKFLPPSFYWIFTYAFMEPSNGRPDGTKDKDMCGAVIERLAKTMIERQPIPRDIVMSAFNRFNSLQNYEKGSVRNNMVRIAVALISKSLIDRKKIDGGVRGMTITQENQDRSFLYGRLLAVYEKIEMDAYGQGDKRETNAIRYQSVFVNRPQKTWAMLEGLITPYFARLTEGSQIYYKRLIGEISGKLAEVDANDFNKPLDELYVLGYYLQRNDFYKSKDNTNEE